MNEKIKELLKQASKLANTDDNKDLDRNFDMIVAEKFAELIVKECAKVADIADENKCEWIGGNILTHFGVEDRAIPILSADEETLLSGITSSKLFTIEAAKKAFGVKE
jgi:hypothetical protein